MIRKFGMYNLVFQFILCAMIGTIGAKQASAQTEPQIGAESSVSKAVERMICRNLANQAIGEEARYKPGVSASGRDVVPAEGEQDDNRVRKVVTVPLTVDLARRMGLAVSDSVELDARLGTLSIDRQGTVRFKDKDITDKTKQLCNGRDGMQQQGPELPVPGSQDADQPPEKLNSPNAPSAPEKAAVPDSPEAPDTQAPDAPASGDDETPRTFKLSPDKDVQSR